jgi:hypothetical protein
LPLRFSLRLEKLFHRLLVPGASFVQAPRSLVVVHPHIAELAAVLRLKGERRNQRSGGADRRGTKACSALPSRTVDFQ